MNTALEFQRRRRRAGMFALPWLVVGIAGVFATNYFSLWEDSREVVSIAFSGLAVIGAMIQFPRLVSVTLLTVAPYLTAAWHTASRLCPSGPMTKAA